VRSDLIKSLWTINGTFNNTGNDVSGNWSVIDSSGTICSGSWGPIILSIEKMGGEIPERFLITQNYPNPFNPSTKIKFALPKPQIVKVEIYNPLGQRIKYLLNEHMKAGYHEIEFTATNLSSGVYFYRIQTGEFQNVKKMILIK
jgi:hypothetical protein